MAIRWPRPRWPGDPKPGKPKGPYPTTGAPRAVRPEIYGVMSVAQVESLLRREQMPAPFVRRMRVINLLSALTLRKIEDNMIAPFEVMDIHHVLDEQISQDAIIAMLENKNLALALETGNMQPLWVESKEKPMLRMGFEQRWIQRFITTPFDPICVMLAMRAKLMLDVVDELGHSYDLLRALGMGWIDFGEIPGEEPGHPDDYIPPLLDAPIDDPDVPVEPVPDTPVPVPEPGDPDYVHPWDVVPGEPGHVPDVDSPSYIAPPLREPWDPGYGGVPGESTELPAGWDEGLFPGSPGYELMPGEEGYIYPRSPGGGYYGGDYGPGGDGAPGGPYGAGGDYASLLPPLPLGFGPGWLLSGRGFGGRWSGGGINCCRDKDNPLFNVDIGKEKTNMDLSETQTLTVLNAHPSCGGENFEWMITQGGGSLSAESGLSVVYTAPASGHNCPGDTEIKLYCGGEIMTDLVITINYDYAIEYNVAASDEEIGHPDSAMVYAVSDNTPLTWAVEGQGFSFANPSPGGLGNVLLADETACGAATITVTDCYENDATGYVRCTAGTLVAGCGDNNKTWGPCGDCTSKQKWVGKYRVDTSEDCLAGGGCYTGEWTLCGVTFDLNSASQMIVWEWVCS